MASRVNTKFVILLCVGVLVLLAMVGVAYTVVRKSGAEYAASGDKMMAEKDYEKAKMFYGRAVGKDRSRADWMGKWIDAMEHMTPETETAYRDAFMTDYIAGVTAMSTIQRTDVAAHERILDIFYEMLRISYSRGSADTLISNTTKALTYFDNHPADDNAWKTLRRYRGLAYDRIVQADGVISDDEFALYKEDLEAALEARPDDTESKSALIRWSLANALREQIEGDTSLLEAARRAAIVECDEYIAENGKDARTMTLRLTLLVDLARSDAGAGLEDAARTVAIVDAFKALQPKVDEVFAFMMNEDPAMISTETVEQIMRVEIATDQASQYRQTRALMDRLVENDPDNASLIWTSARIDQQIQDRESAIALYNSIIALPTRPLSFEGMMLYTRKRQSLISIADIRLDQYQIANLENEDGSPVAPELLSEAEQLIEEFSTSVSEDDNQLMMMRGRILEAKGDLNSALSMYKKYNEQTQNQFVDGLWREGSVARKLGQLGTARSALRQVLAKNRFDLRAMLTLADIEMRLNNHRAAADQYRQILIYDPDNELALQGMESVQAIEDPSSIADTNPALALILRSRQVRLGTDGQPGDLASAIEILSKGIEIPAINYDPSVARELAMLLMDNGDVVGARATIVQSSSRYPDDPIMTRIAQAMQSDDPIDILVTLINQSEQSEISKEISIANVYLQHGRSEELDTALQSLAQKAPNDRRAIEMRFSRSMQKSDLATAKSLAEHATSLNLDNVRGLTFKARIESFQNEHAKAVRTLQQATALGSADASVYRMLAMEQRVMGQIDASAASFEQALAIRPNDVSTIYEYAATLTRAGRFEEALEVARAHQNFGVSSSDFNNLWLMLESNYGGDAGREFAIRQRERMLELNAADLGNTFELARMYVASKQWKEAKTLIDSLRAGNDRLAYAELEALWNADQGRIGKTSGLIVARRVYDEYIESLGDEVTAAPFISLARFMLNRGRPDLATRAAQDAIRLEDPITMEGSKLHGDLLMSINQYAQAADAYQSVVDSGQSDPDHKYRAKLIEAYLRVRKYDAALAQLENMPPEQQQTKVSMLQRAEILNGLDRIAESRVVLNDVVAKFPEDPIVFIKRAESMIGEPELMTDLLADVEQALKINGNDWRAYRVRAAAFFAADRQSDAMRDLQNAVRINPNLDSALFSILNELVASNRAGEAFDLAKEVVDRRPNDAPLMAQIGHLFAQRLDWNRAAEMYGLAWEKRRSPSDGAIYIDALVRTTPPDTDTANKIINDLAQLVDGGVDSNAGLLAASALVLDARGRTDFAIQQVTKAFDLSVDEDSQLISWYGNVARFFEKKPIASEIQYLESIRRRKNIPQVQLWIDLFIAQRLAKDGGDMTRSRAKLEQLLSRSDIPRLQLFAYQTYGSMLFGMDDFAGAEDLWKRGIALFEDDWEMNNNMAYMLSEKLGRSEEALSYMETAIARGVSRPEPYETAARIYTRLGQYDKAHEVIREGIRFALTVESRVSLINADARLKLAEGDLVAAKAQVLSARSVLRALPGRNEELEQTINDIEEEINSAE